MLIVGGGCAGLSAAFHLLGRGFGGTIGIVEPRQVYRRDRTWCFWSGPAGDDPAADVPAEVRAAVRWTWPAWRVVGNDGHAIERRREGWRYCGLPADAFYEVMLGRLEGHPRVRWWRGWSATTVNGRQVEVGRNGRRATLCGATVVDTRPTTSYAVSPANPARVRPEVVGPGGAALVQQFVGAEFVGPAGDAACVTLMDFRATAGEDGLSFLYVLPLGGGRVLAEWTGMLPAAVQADEAWRRLARAVGRGLPGFERSGDYAESGVLPMSTTADRPAAGGGAVRRGVRGGACRPSTGYAFLQIQRQAATFARYRVDKSGDDDDFSRSVASLSPRPAWLAYLDAVFLRRLSRRPADFPAVFVRLFRHVRPDRLARFLADVPTVRDGAAVVAAMPKLPFAAEAVRGHRWVQKAKETDWDRHRRLAVGATAGLTLLIVAWTLLGRVPVGVQVGLLVAAASIGMAHGATDVWIGRQLFGGDGAGARRFGGGYLLLAAAALGLHLVAPPVWLAGFLVLSAVHIGFGELPGLLPRSAGEAAASALRGLMPLTLPALLHEADVAAALAALVEVPAATATASVLAALAPAVAIGAAAWATWEMAARRWWAAAEWVAVGLLLAIAPPLLGFAIYFAVWHSVRHLLSDVVDAPSAGRGAGRPWAPVVSATALPIVAAALVWAVLVAAPSVTAAADMVAVRVVFVTLGCLTVPHMALVLLAAKRHAPARRRRPASRTLFTPPELAERS